MFLAIHLPDNKLSQNVWNVVYLGLFNLDQDIPAFKDHLRDFLVQIREFTG